MQSSCATMRSTHSFQISFSSASPAVAGNTCRCSNPLKIEPYLLSNPTFRLRRGRSTIMTSVACARPDSSTNVAPAPGVSLSQGNTTTQEKRRTLREIAEELKKHGEKHVPHNYVVVETERPNVRHDEFADLPVVDLALIDSDRSELARQLGQAATEWGFFQIVSHGLSVDDHKEIETQGFKFFHLPTEIKFKLDKHGYYSDNTEVKQSSLHWAESWMINCVPINNLEDKVNIIFPQGNSELRDSLIKYCQASETVNKLILELLAEYLGLERNFFSQHLNSRRSLGLRLNYYPACPQPSHVLGASVHTDGCSLTVLQQDKVGGLQIQKDGQWFGVKPIEGALVVNVGDSLHAWTNGHLKSVLHRVVLNKDVERFSLAAFLNVDNDLVLSAPDQLVDENHPRLYKPFTFIDYAKQLVRARNGDNDESKTMMDGNRVLAGLSNENKHETKFDD